MQCYKHFCCKKAIILAYIEFKSLALEYLKSIASHEWVILSVVVALLKIFADVINFYEKENLCISSLRQWQVQSLL